MSAATTPEGRIVWITGLPASGKTTLATRIVRALHARGVVTLALDSDDLRSVLTPEADYSPADRDRFYEALGHLAVLGAEGGATVVISATASRRAYRDRVRERFPRFIEVQLVCDEETRKKRDPKHLYARAERAELRHLPGSGALYEPAEHAELTLDSARLDVDAMRDAVLGFMDAQNGSSSENEWPRLVRVF
jgi:adenylylsulfate kinase